jgi:DHA2 family multidrug resistance protein
MIRLAAGMSAGARRNLLTVCAMTATIMQALDTTVANVALPYMQGSLSASLDQINWVLTSYIVASAIMTAPIGWMSDRFGRKRLFTICCAGFTFASLLCATSQDIGSMVFARLLQGAFGAALVPLSQSVMLDAYPPEQRGQAMAIWGLGVMLGPILGPALGGFLTDRYSWHWVFLINLPVGVITVLGLMLFMDETRKQEHLRFDWFGFIALAIGIGSLQLLLDRGEQVGWYDSPEIVVETIISVAGFYYFFAHSFTTDQPFVRFELFKDRNFAAACLFMVMIGVSLFGTMALITPFTQNLLGYPILTAGFVLGSRGVGTLIAMMAVGRLLKFIEARTLVFCGLTLTAVTLYVMVGFTTDTSMQTIVVTGIIQGGGLGLVFVPLSTVAFASLPGHLRNSGTAMLT